MENRAVIVLGQIVKVQSKEHGYPTDQLFFAIYVKNNKLTGIYSAYIKSYNHAKYQICDKKSKKSENSNFC